MTHACCVNPAHTHPANWPSHGGHATLSDGQRTLIICDLGGHISIGGITVDDPTTLDRLADYAHQTADRLRQEGPTR